MKVVAAYLLAVLGGNDSPTADDLKSILGSVGAVPDDEKINLLLSRTNGETLSSLIRSGYEKMMGPGVVEFSSSSGGAAAVPQGEAAAVPQGGDAAVPQGGAAPPPPGLGAAAPSLVACATRGRRVQVPRMIPVLRMTEDGHEYDDMWVDVYGVDNIWDLEASAIAEIRYHSLRLDIEDAENYAIAYEITGYFHYPTAHDLEAENVPWVMIRDNLARIDGYDRNE